MFKDAATLFCLDWACLAGTVVCWLVPIVRWQVRARVKAKQRYRLLSCPGSAAAAASELLGAALEAEQLVQPAAEGAARQPTAAAEEGSSSSAAIIAAAISSGTNHSSSYKGPHIINCK